MRYSSTAPVKIVVIGAGGTGGYVIPHLYRLGYASHRYIRIIVCDGDVVEEKNLIRQNFIEFLTIGIIRPKRKCTAFI